MSKNIEKEPAIPEQINQEAVGPIVHIFNRRKEMIDPAREAARRHPEYMATLFRVAAKLYPNDSEMRQAFLNGTELVTSLERHKQMARELNLLVMGPLDDGEALDQLPTSA